MMRVRVKRPAIAAFLVVIAAAGLTAGLAGCKRGFLIDTKQEVEMGKQASKDVERERSVSKDQSAQELVNSIGQKVAQAAKKDRGGIEYHFKALEDKNVNAFALPGGWVYINSGLLDF
jgi:predicted Zn-dependent protease